MKTSMLTPLFALVLTVTLASSAVAGPPMDVPGMGGNGGKEGKVPMYALARQAGLTTLADLVELAGLQRTLQVAGPLTVFAPTNEAFAALAEAVGEDVLNMIISDTELLTTVLLYHVVDPELGAVPAEIAKTLDSAPMANGESVSISFDGMDLMVNDATVIGADVMARNGIVHVVDSVLVPPSVLAALSESRIQASKAPSGATEDASFGGVKAFYGN